MFDRNLLQNAHSKGINKAEMLDRLKFESFQNLLLLWSIHRSSDVGLILPISVHHQPTNRPNVSRRRRRPANSTGWPPRKAGTETDSISYGRLTQPTGIEVSALPKCLTNI
jgi:hypothetical protein